MALNKAQKYRSDHADLFRKIKEGVWGGFKKGVQNGPPPYTERGNRRNNTEGA